MKTINFDEKTSYVEKASNILLTSISYTFFKRLWTVAQGYLIGTDESDGSICIFFHESDFSKDVEESNLSFFLDIFYSGFKNAGFEVIENTTVEKGTVHGVEFESRMFRIIPK